MAIVVFQNSNQKYCIDSTGGVSKTYEQYKPRYSYALNPGCTNRVPCRRRLVGVIYRPTSQLED